MEQRPSRRFQTEESRLQTRMSIRSNPNKADLAAPIPITFQVQHDPNIIITARGANQGVATVAVPGTSATAMGRNDRFAATDHDRLEFSKRSRRQPIRYKLQSTQLPPVITPLQLIAGRTELVIPSERQVFLEVLKPDGTVQERIALEESILDGNLELIRNCLMEAIGSKCKSQVKCDNG